jgi:hypothetical protein
VSREQWGYLFWGLLFGVGVVVPQLLAMFWAGSPWPTISRAMQKLEQRFHWVAVLVLAGLAVLAFHIVLYPWPSIPHR